MPDGSKPPVWFAFDESRPLAFFAGIWATWTSVRKVKEGPVRADLFGFLTSAPNAEVAAVHPEGDAGDPDRARRVGDVAGRALAGGEGAAAAVAGRLAAHCAPGREGGFRGDTARYADEWMTSASNPPSLEPRSQTLSQLPEGADAEAACDQVKRRSWPLPAGVPEPARRHRRLRPAVAQEHGGHRRHPGRPPREAAGRPRHHP